MIKASVLYFALVFEAGFVLGVLRTLFVEPRLGKRRAELLEMPFMLVITVLSAGWTMGRLTIPSSASAPSSPAGSRSFSCWQPSLA